MRLSVFTAMMVDGRVFDGSGKKLPPIECVEKIVEAGYEGIEWGIADSYGWTPAVAESEAEQIGTFSRRYGLQTVAVSSGASVDDITEVRRMLEIAARLGAPALRVGLRGYDSRKSYREQMKRAASEFARAMDIARPFRIKLLVEIHFDFLCPSASLAQRFISQFDSDVAGVIYDPGNMIVEGHENWKIGAELLGDHLAHVHVKNTACTHTQTGWPWQFVGLDRGLVNWAAVIAALRSAGYDGWLSLEDFSTRPLEQKLHEGKLTLSRLLGVRSGRLQTAGRARNVSPLKRATTS